MSHRKTDLGIPAPEKSAKVVLDQGGLPYLPCRSPTPHFVSFAQDVLCRGVDFSIVWPEILARIVTGSVYFAIALYRFRRVIFSG
jgi:hypothetical protein